MLRANEVTCDVTRCRKAAVNPLQKPHIHNSNLFVKSTTISMFPRSSVKCHVLKEIYKQGVIPSLAANSDDVTTDKLQEKLPYKDVGVDIDALSELVQRSAKMAPGIGGFGGLLPLGYSILEDGTDGVGTKLKLACAIKLLETIGIDLPAEMLDFHQDSEYDLSGSALGIMKKNQVINGKNIKAGGVLISLPCSGVHSNGFPLGALISKDSREMTAFAFAGDISHPSLLPRGRRRGVCVKAMRYDKHLNVIGFTYDTDNFNSDEEVSHVFRIPPPPLPTIIVVVPKRHVATVERFGKFYKMIGTGTYYLIPFLDTIKAVHKNEYPLPDVKGYEVGGTIKWKVLKEPCHEEQGRVGVIVKVVLEKEINEWYLTGGVVEEAFNKSVEDKINLALTEDLRNKYTVELELGYVKPLSHSESIERKKEKMREKEKFEEKKDEKNKKLAEMGTKLVMAIFVWICGRIIPKEARAVIVIVMQIYITISLSQC